MPKGDPIQPKSNSAQSVLYMFVHYHKLLKVLPDGTYVRPPQDKIGYGTMVFVRVAICQDVCAHLKKAATIAVRYSAVRRQVIETLRITIISYWGA